MTIKPSFDHARVLTKQSPGVFGSGRLSAANDDTIAIHPENMELLSRLPNNRGFIRSLTVGLERELKLPRHAAEAFAQAKATHMQDAQKLLGSALPDDDPSIVALYLNGAIEDARIFEALYDLGAYELRRLEKERQEQLPDLELWEKRVDKSESAPKFYERVWGPRQRAWGIFKRLIYRDDVDRRDPKLMAALRKYASMHKNEIDVRPPPAAQRSLDLLETLPPHSPAAVKLRQKLSVRTAVARHHKARPR